MTQTLNAETTVEKLSLQSQEQFIASLDGIFEHSPWVAERAWEKRPFDSVDSLFAAMFQAVENASRQEQLDLICAHPELAGKEAESGTLTKESTGEQKGAGLDQCTPDELVRLRSLNARYLEKFGFPFVIAVKGFTRHQIMDHAEARLNNDKEVEFQTCLKEIGKIARFRLDAQFGA